MAKQLCRIKNDDGTYKVGTCDIPVTPAKGKVVPGGKPPAKGKVVPGSPPIPPVIPMQNEIKKEDVKNG